jgi:hypothetical protein
MHSPRDVQAKVASVIPLARFGPRTRRMLEQQFHFGENQKGRTIGGFAAQFGGATAAGQAPPPKATTPDPTKGKGITRDDAGNFHFTVHGANIITDKDGNILPGSTPAPKATTPPPPAKDKFGNEPGTMGPSTLRPDTPIDPSSPLAPKDHDRWGNKPGEMGPSDLSPQQKIDPNSPLAPAGQQDVNLLDQARKAGVIQTAADGKIKGEASLEIGLASGLKPIGGVENRGDLFHEIQLSRA